MNQWRWEDAFVTFLQESENYPQILRRFIAKHGVNNEDSAKRSIFMVMTLCSIYNRDIIDIVFEFKPDLMLLIDNAYIEWSSLSIYYYNDYYILSKFLEQDIEYRYLRHPFKWETGIYPDFITFLCIYMGFGTKNSRSNDIIRFGFVGRFRSHFCKGITFFDIMLCRYSHGKI